MVFPYVTLSLLIDMKNPALRGSASMLSNLIRLEASRPYDQLITHKLTFIQASKALVFKRIHVNEKVRPFLRNNKAKAFMLTKPLDSTLVSNGHYLSPEIEITMAC
jgi:hypothetical protein